MTHYVVLEHNQHEAGVSLLHGFRDKSAAVNFVYQLLELKAVNLKRLAKIVGCVENRAGSSKSKLWTSNEPSTNHSVLCSDGN